MVLAHPSIAARIARHGAEAVAVARAFRPDVILLDVGMPVMDGFEAFRALRADPDLGSAKVFFVTADARRDELQMAVDMGAAGWMHKPLDLESLRRRVFSALEIKTPV